MTSFREVLFSPVAVNKFLHTITSGFVLSSLALIGTGDGSAKQVAKVQSMKLAAMEGLYNGYEGVGLIAVGAFKSTSEEGNDAMKDFLFKIEIPNFLSFLAFGDWNAFVPKVNDIIHGNPEKGIMSVHEKMDRGKMAIEKLSAYKEAKKNGDEALSASLVDELTSDGFQQNYFRYLGYGHINDTNFLIPNIPLVFYSFHIMVMLGFLFLLMFVLALWWVVHNKLDSKKWFLIIAVFMIPLAYLATERGWLVAEIGRQPWVIQDLMPTTTAVSQISTASVQITFALFAVIFTTLLIAILFSFIIQAVSYEYRTKPANFLGTKVYGAFLIVNGLMGTILIGIAVGTFFNGAQFSLNECNQVTWQTGARGLEAALNVHNLSLGLTVFFLTCVLALLYFNNTIYDMEISARTKKHLLINAVPFVVFFLFFVVVLLLKNGYAYNPGSMEVTLEKYKYLHNLLEMPVVFIFFLAGTVLVLFGIFNDLLRKAGKEIWFSGVGTVLVVFPLFLTAVFNNT